MPSADPHVVILAGGIGSRFWPASTPSRPKQLLPLASPRPLIVDTLTRARALTPEARIHILAGAPLVDPFRGCLPGLPDSAYWVEPRARGTAPVLAWAAHRIHQDDPGGVMISLHADHRIDPMEAFAACLREAAVLAAEADALVTVGVPPDRPETGFGWIRPGEPVALASSPASLLNPTLANRTLRSVEAFVEKPDLATARRYLDEGLLWNSGIFVWPVARFLEELRLHSPEVGPHLPLLDQGREEAFFDAVTPISVDHAVLERSRRVAVVGATFDWDDVGSWGALPRTRPADEAGNVTQGDVVAVESTGNVVWADDGSVVLFGVDDLVVVRTGGLTVVAPRGRTGDWKSLLQQLPESRILQAPSPAPSPAPHPGSDPGTDPGTDPGADPGTQGHP